jgi:hypothetical protein
LDWHITTPYFLVYLAEVDTFALVAGPLILGADPIVLRFTLRLVRSVTIAEEFYVISKSFPPPKKKNPPTNCMKQYARGNGCVELMRGIPFFFLPAIQIVVAPPPARYTAPRLTPEVGGVTAVDLDLATLLILFLRTVKFSVTPEVTIIEVNFIMT